MMPSAPPFRITVYAWLGSSGCCGAIVILKVTGSQDTLIGTVWLAASTSWTVVSFTSESGSGSRAIAVGVTSTATTAAPGAGFTEVICHRSDAGTNTTSTK